MARFPFFFLAGPREGKRTLFFSAHIPKRKCDLTSRGYARSTRLNGAPLGVTTLGLNGLTTLGLNGLESLSPRLLLFPMHVCTIHEEGPEAPLAPVASVGPLAPLDASSDSTSRRSSTESRPHGYAWTAPRYSLITHAALRGRNRPIFRGAGHAAPMEPMSDHAIKSHALSTSRGAARKKRCPVPKRSFWGKHKYFFFSESLVPFQEKKSW
jgi:hypothetical protein